LAEYDGEILEESDEFLNAQKKNIKNANLEETLNAEL